MAKIKTYRKDPNWKKIFLIEKYIILTFIIIGFVVFFATVIIKHYGKT
jgi:hypothetical protein